MKTALYDWESSKRAHVNLYVSDILVCSQPITKKSFSQWFDEQNIRSRPIYQYSNVAATLSDKNCIVLKFLLQVSQFSK